MGLIIADTWIFFLRRFIHRVCILYVWKKCDPIY